MEPVTTAGVSTPLPADRPSAMPPVLNRLMRGTFFLALKTPMQVVFAFVSIPLVQHYIGDGMNGAFVFAWGFGFFQFLLEFGMSSALQREVSESWTRGDRDGVDRCIACGMSFYAAMTLIQIVALFAIAYLVLPTLDKFSAEEYRLIVRLIWLQALTAPFYGLSAVLSSVLQAARRYDFMPRLELVVVFLRFCVLAGGLAAGLDFFWVVVAQTALQIALTVGPALWVMIRDLGYRPHFLGATWSDMRSLLHISGYMFLMQLSVILADKIDTTILGFALPKIDAGPAITIYQNVSKPFLQIRQTGWTLVYLVMPAVASLAAARDEAGIDRIKYDGPRFLTGLLLPVTLLAAIYAGPFLNLWVGERFEPYAPLLRLFLIATLPLLIAVQVQMAIGMGQVKVIAIAAIVGALINLPVSYLLTRQIGVAGVIWGTVLTTLFSNLLVPGLHVIKVLKIDLRAFLTRTLSAPLAGALALILATTAFRLALPANPGTLRGWVRYAPFAANLSVGVISYVLGYVATPTGRADLTLLGRKLRRRAG
jgi:O-antigen/teichoic acid export membrane protein